MNANHKEAYELACMKRGESNLALAYIDLGEENARLREENKAFESDVGAIAAHNIELQEQLAAAQLDAARYRCLRDGQCWPAAFYDHDEPEPLRGEELDAAIDKAIEQEQCE